MPQEASVLCFGEILWDALPSGLFPGGAPFNVAYHLRRHGCDPLVISAVGRDRLGEELLRRLRGWEMRTDGVAELDAPTGFVRATIGPAGDAKYEILEDVAWDSIPLLPGALPAAARCGALVFGSLAQRSEGNRSNLRRLREALSGEALQVFDVNLRAPFDDLQRISELARGASVVKLNADEARRLCGLSGTGGEESLARGLVEAFETPIVVITAGSRGAGMLRKGAWHWEPGRPIRLADTVGAGDAFLAALVTGLIRGEEDPAKLLERACRLGEWVASQHGATPPYRLAPPDVREFAASSAGA